MNLLSRFGRRYLRGRRAYPHAATLLLATLAAAILVGCGGGGGGSSSSLFGRSFAFSSGGNVLDMTVDPNGRFTAFVMNSTAAPTGIGVQGTVLASGAFSAQASSGGLQVSGQIASSGTTATGQVTSNGQTLFSFTAQEVTPGISSPSGAAGTYTGSSASPAASVLLSADSTSHGTLWVSLNGTTGGGLVTIAADSSLQTADGATTARWSPSLSSGTNFTLTKLNGTAVNLPLTLAHATRAKWTFLVYLDAANNLRDDGPLNFSQMEEVGSTADVNIVVQWKQASCSDCGTSSWYSTRRYLVTKNTSDIAQNGGQGTDNVQSTLIQDLGNNVDMGNWRTLQDFISWGQQNYPADHTALVIWDHGSGWFPISGYTARAISFDDATKSEIEVWQLPQALTSNSKLDMVILDASLMQMTETAYEIRDQTGVLVGSEESPPGAGYPYHLILGDLAANPNMTASQYGADIVHQTVNYYINNPSLNSAQNNTQSAVDETKVAAIATSLNSFAGTLISHATDSAAVLASARTNAENYDPSAGYGDFKDLYDYSRLIQQNAATPVDLKAAAGNVITAFNSAIIANQVGPNHSKSHGLSIYVPAPADYVSTYSNLALAKNTAWPQWLRGQKQ